MRVHHIDAILGPERNPRQGVGAADILRWQEAWRKRRAGAEGEGIAPKPAPVLRVPTGMDEFFARVPD